MNVSKLVLHPASERQLTSYAALPSHGLIILGAEGAGKGAASRWLAVQLLGLPGETVLEKYPHVRTIMPDGQSISIAAVRGLLQFTKLKVAGGRETTRIAIIEQAHLLTHEAQNALLKLLEEPPEGTVLILTAVNGQSLLPTIRSRAQSITMQTPSQSALADYFSNQGHADQTIRQAYFMSGGLPGLMKALLQDSDEHPLAQASKQARELLQADTFTRLARVDALAKQRGECSRVLFMLQQMAHAALVQAADKNAANASLARWQRILYAGNNAEAALVASAQPKLVLTNLMLSI